jgi:Na+-transporting NADH:ubiquinone oxidoreductase subunit F
MKTFEPRDYSLVGKDTAKAIANGLAEAKWYASPVPKQEMRKLLERRDGPAIRDTLIWFVLIVSSAVAGFMLWGTWWVIIPFFVYGVMIGTTTDSRWHESLHGTAFKTDWMNNALYEFSAFLVSRESTRWRWSHTRHHSDTLIIGRDQEIAVVPPDVLGTLLRIVNINTMYYFVRSVLRHCTGRLDAEEKTFIPESDYGKVVRVARIYFAVYATVIGLSIYTGSILPLMYVGLPNFYGAWLMFVYGFTQHAILPQNVLDHRLNCRTVYMNTLNRYLYWNMNYHVEHHMFPLVPYHALPRLHEIVKADMPKAYSSLLDAWREIIPAFFRQWKDPAFYVERPLPTPTIIADASPTSHIFTAKGRPVGGWVEICASEFLQKEDVIRFDHENKTYAIYRSADGNLYATNGVCTHSNAHLADGFVSGTLVECANHNGRFDIIDGSPRRPPVCVGLTT